MRTTLRRAALLPSALMLAALVVPGTAQADTSTDTGTASLGSPAAAAATWAGAQLTDGNYRGDHGLNADIVMGLVSTGTNGTIAGQATDWLEANAGSYVHRGGAERLNAGGTAKLALVAAVQDRDPSDFGGLDLTGLLLGQLQESGRFSDKAPSDLSNQFTQSLAVLAFNEIGEVPDNAVDFLASTQCPNGGFPLSLARNPDRCNPDPDSTGMAVQAMIAVGRGADAAKSLDWLAGAQQSGGGFSYNGSASVGANSNSTALAVQALAAGGREKEAQLGIDYLRSLQVGCDAEPGHRGAVGYDEASVDGMTLRATAQVIPALAGKALFELDGKSVSPEPYAIDCTPGGGDNGGSTGGGSDTGGDSGSGGGDNGGSTGGDSTGGDDANGGGDTTGGDTTGGDSTGGDDTTGGDGDATTGGDDSTGGDGDGTTGGTDATGGGDGGLGGTSGLTGGTGDLGNDPAPNGGGLANTGTSALSLLAAAVGLLIAGALAYVVTMRRRRTTV
ncbi:prenyltransferase/squalene oxidase repeat-containing protein [Streptomyces sp. SM14]|uniref:prenyltransferase/squalene oxidase repeat-containing protein n=1 Tax=Streptomyces sp. SM14 TaxID=1736045 RepID=UPI000CD5C34B|nr:prenyltransferase/squalene oxidase repeat-containing protein [Streptomyces sp. SM14]